jgi:hypothetical protein
MKLINFILASLLLYTQFMMAMDAELIPLITPSHSDSDGQSPLIQSHDSEFELVVIEDGITIQQAYDQGLHAHKEGHLVFIHKNLNSCAGLSTLKDKLHLDTIMYVNFSNNKLREVPAEIFTTMPNLVKCDLSGNAITKMCHHIPPHQKLKTLLLYNNQLTHIPLEKLLQNVPLKQLILDENKITSYELLRTDHPSLEELWLGKNVQKWVKQMIASRCPNLVAEMCEGDTTVQDTNTKTEYSEKCRKKCCTSTIIGLLCGAMWGVGLGVIGALSCIHVRACNNIMYHAIPDTAGIAIFVPGVFCVSATTGATLSPLINIYCRTNPEERITKTILKPIAQYPPIIEALRKQTQNKINH